MGIFKRVLRRSLGGSGLVFVLAGAIAAVAIAITPAQTRESYVAQVEPICKRNTEANERILAGVRSKIRNGKLKVAAGQFTRAANAFAKAVTELRGVQQPVEDSDKLASWLEQLDVQTALLRKVGRALREEKRNVAQSTSVKLTQNGNLANSLVLGFGFVHCRIDSSKFL